MSMDARSHGVTTPEGQFSARARTHRPILIRPLQPDDRSRLVQFMAALSDTSRHSRLMYTARELSEESLNRLMAIDYGLSMALVAVVIVEGSEVIVGVARYAPTEDPSRSEFAIVIADAWQRQTVGTQLLVRLFAYARQQALTHMHGEAFAQNVAMLALARHIGATVRRNPTDAQLVELTLTL